MMHRNERGAGAVQVVLLVLGILFVMAGIGLVAEGMIVSAALSGSGLGGTFASLGGTYEAAGAVLLILGLVQIGAAVATWDRRRKKRR